MSRSRDTRGTVCTLPRQARQARGCELQRAASISQIINHDRRAAGSSIIVDPMPTGVDWYHFFAQVIADEDEDPDDYIPIISRRTESDLRPKDQERRPLLALARSNKKWFSCLLAKCDPNVTWMEGGAKMRLEELLQRQWNEEPGREIYDMYLAKQAQRENTNETKIKPQSEGETSPWWTKYKDEVDLLGLETPTFTGAAVGEAIWEAIRRWNNSFHASGSVDAVRKLFDQSSKVLGRILFGLEFRLEGVERAARGNRPQLLRIYEEEMSRVNTLKSLLDEATEGMDAIQTSSSEKKEEEQMLKTLIELHEHVVSRLASFEIHPEDAASSPASQITSSCTLYPWESSPAHGSQSERAEMLDILTPFSHAFVGSGRAKFSGHESPTPTNNVIIALGGHLLGPGEKGSEFGPELIHDSSARRRVLQGVMRSAFSEFIVPIVLEASLMAQNTTADDVWQCVRAMLTTTNYGRGDRIEAVGSLMDAVFRRFLLAHQSRSRTAILPTLLGPDQLLLDFAVHYVHPVALHAIADMQRVVDQSLEQPAEQDLGVRCVHQAMQFGAMKPGDLPTSDEGAWRDASWYHLFQFLTGPRRTAHTLRSMESGEFRRRSAVRYIAPYTCWRDEDGSSGSDTNGQPVVEETVHDSGATLAP